MERAKQTERRKRVSSVGWTDLSENDSLEQAGSESPANGEPDVARSEDCLVANSNRLKESFEDLSASLAELSTAMEETIR
ncbi:MAG: hypothetical protein V5A52_08610 [Halovenus sp.]|uniref:hypothetical protein n=1 Tax=Halovenus amylolytica TaxID=2500550 RepID=UPI000FE31E1E